MKEVWLNIYSDGEAYWTSGMFYSSRKTARTKLCDKEHYYCTLNVETGEKVTTRLRK